MCFRLTPAEGSIVLVPKISNDREDREQLWAVKDGCSHPDREDGKHAQHFQRVTEYLKRSFSQKKK